MHCCVTRPLHEREGIIKTQKTESMPSWDSVCKTEFYTHFFILHLFTIATALLSYLLHNNTNTTSLSPAVAEASWFSLKTTKLLQLHNLVFFWEKMQSSIVKTNVDALTFFMGARFLQLRTCIFALWFCKDARENCSHLTRNAEKSCINGTT